MTNVKTGSSNPKLYAKAAESLGVESDVVAAAISGLAQIFLESAKMNSSESDFTETLSSLQLSEEQMGVLAQAYQSNFRFLRLNLANLDMKLEHYHNLDWRLDIELGSRCLRNHAKPSFVLELETKDAADKTKTTGLECDYANMKHMVDELEKALSEAGNSHCRRIITYVK
eukprot:CAMPEP_0175140916 /NCGR_PEP_ID=MMETSP0087-20121206/11789_1 /TAXON_ID=136419 /ORGANISM="Unknown Unknown, Strain D1" /LENGTH=170 /DNA_ID=CAMNT_0016424221 /DNA_START=126 /DNA_END=638 /DNA_ORIENTATION=-